MKNKVIFIVILFHFITTSCTDESNTPLQEEEISPIGIWFRTDPQFVAISPTENIERGELHTLLNLRADGVFSLKRITLGIYLDDNPEDTSAFRDDLGNYRIDGDSIHVNLHTRIIWDSFYGDDLEPDSTENLYGNLFREATYQIEGDSLFFNYHNLEGHGPNYYNQRLIKRQNQ